VKALSSDQLDVVCNRSWLQAKADATVTLTAELHTLSEVLRTELARRVGEWDVPGGFDASAFQVARGESLENLPYQYLDCPRYYSRDEIFSFRVLIWWGKAVNHCWVVKGERLGAIRERLISRRGEMDPEMCIWAGSDLWDWSAPLPLSQVDDGELRRMDFFKIGFSQPLTAPHLSATGLQADALAAWGAIVPLFESD